MEAKRKKGKDVEREVGKGEKRRGGQGREGERIAEKREEEGSKDDGREGEKRIEVE